MKLRELLRFERAHYGTWDDAEAERLVTVLEVPDDIELRAMSRGQATKAMLCLALAHRPALLLLDEPFSGIDPVARDEVLRAVISALDGAQRTVLCATHELDVAARIADRVAILRDGRIARHGALAEILDCGDEADAAPRRLAEEFAAATQGQSTC